MIDFSQHIFSHRQNFSELPAIKIDNRIISYEELVDNAMRVASALVDAGACNETIGLVGQRQASSYIGLLGIIFAGCNYTPVNPKYNSSRLSNVINGANVQFLVGDLNDIEKLNSSVTSGIKLCILPERNSPNDSSLTFTNGDDLAENKYLIEPVNSNGGDLAYINFTSGSTGTPKGVMVSRDNLQAFLSNMKLIYNLEPGFRASQTFDLSFDPSVSDIFFTWMELGTLYVLPEAEILNPSDFIVREKSSFWNSVPSIANFMLRTGNLRSGSFPDLRYSMFIGELFPSSLGKAWSLAAPNSTVENFYGPTETTIYITRFVYSIKSHNKQFHNGIIPIGQPFNGHSVALVDEKGQKINDSRTGEIVFSGAQLARGYLNNDSETAKSFVKFDWDFYAKTWYKTGDLGFFNASGDLECIGRSDNQIKVGGRRLEIGEVESVLSKFELAKYAVVVPLRSQDGIVTGLVAFTLSDITKTDIIQLRKQCSELLDNVFFPKKIFTITEFPLAPSGKTDRKRLEEHAKDLMGQK